MNEIVAAGQHRKIVRIMRAWHFPHHDPIGRDPRGASFVLADHGVRDRRIGGEGDEQNAGDACDHAWHDRREMKISTP